MRTGVVVTTDDRVDVGAVQRFMMVVWGVVSACVVGGLWGSAWLVSALIW